MIKFSELLHPAYYIPAAKCAGLGFVLFLAAWWRGGRAPRSSGFALLLLGLGWALCHLIVDPNSYVHPPKEPANWLLFGALALVPVAAVVWVTKRGAGLAAVIGGIILGITAWLALHHPQLRWLIDRTETARDRWLWTSGLLSAVLAAYGAAEACARKIPSVLMMTALALFAALAGLALLQLAMPQSITARLLAVAFLALGAVISGLVHYSRRQLPAHISPGIAGWIAGGSVLLFIVGCVSRVSGGPVLPMAAAAATFPAAALFLYTCGRALGGNALIFMLVILGGGISTAVFAARDRDLAAASSSSTGADDTGAYEGL